MSRRWSLVLGAAAASHLILVSLGALEMLPDGPGWVGRQVANYAALSGADNGYGFFAPSVGTIFRAKFAITDVDGVTTTDVLERGASHEASRRMGYLVDMFWDAEHDAELQRSLVASWVGKMFARHPEAKSITAQLDVYFLPTMAEYRQGSKPAWDPHYQATFVRRSQFAKEVNP